MQGILAQSWTTVRGDATSPGPGVTSITQAQTAWFDVSDFEDLVFYLSVREITGTVTMSYETSASFEEAAFRPLVVPFTMSVPADGSPRVDLALACFAANPAAKYARWRVSAASATVWGATFRLWIASYGPNA